MRRLTAGRKVGAMLALAGAAVPVLAVGGWRPDPQLLADLERRKVSWTYRESEVPPYTLPDPLVGPDGRRASSRREWEQRVRPATLDLFRRHVYGRGPSRPSEVRFQVTATDPEALGGRAVLKQIEITARGGGREFRFPAAVFVPRGRAPSGRRAPAFLLINNRAESSADPSRRQQDGFWPVEEIIARGYAAAVFRTVDVDPDEKGEAARARGVRGVWPGALWASGGTAGEDAWATLGAWAWGAGRVLDYLVTDSAIDGKRVAVVGHSRGGKTALWAGAQDERFALVISNDSGCGGAALSRRRFGETVEAINRGFPYWFCGRFKQYDNREAELPVDQHQLLSLIAPRGLYVASADADFWADQRGEFLSLVHAAPVYALYGHPGVKPDEMPPLDTPLVRGRVAYHVRRGAHNLTPYDWHRFMDFADALWDHKRPPS